MRKLLQTIFCLYLFWFVIFILGRAAFLFYQYNFHLPSGFIPVLFAGWQLDLSTASYLTAIPCMVLCLQLFFYNDALRKIFYLFHYLLIPVILILTISSILLYKSWSTLLNAKALSYALEPVEMIASLTNRQLFFVLLILIIVCVVFIFLFRKIINWNEQFRIKSQIVKSVFILSLFTFLIIGIRGGLQEIPVNESDAAFSQDQIKNDIATNNIWYLSNSVLKSGFENNNPYVELKKEEAFERVERLYNHTHSTKKVIKDSIKPNIVVLLLESWAADVIEPLDGLKNITPFFSSLADSGLLFTNIYATGRRTDQALPSVICGFPAQPDRSIMRYSDKIKKLPFITKVLTQYGYSSSYYYGGDLAFNNMHNFLLDAGFNNIIGKEVFPDKDQNSKWGAHDEYVLMKQAKDFNQLHQPFFSVLLTLTSHEPFEIPTKPKFSGTNDSALFINAVHYTDESLKKYFAYAKQQPWYPNTLFILVADHGHILPLNRPYYNPRTHHIPLLFYGEVLKQEYKGKQETAAGNQNDIPATLLSQLNIASEKFRWSNDLLNPDRKNFAYINYDEHFGWMWTEGYYRYFSEKKEIQQEKFLKNPVRDEILNGIAYRQKLFDDFLYY